MVTWLATLAISGANWKALAPVPITRMFLPVRSCSCSHSVEWKAMPRNFSWPGMSGHLGRFSWPTALITALACSTCSWPSAPFTDTSQAPLSSSKRAWVTSVPKRVWRLSP